MEAQEDFRDLLALFNAHNVEYVIVGAHALAFHGAPRYTGDMDILVKADRENAQRILAALEEFGFGSVGTVRFSYRSNKIRIIGAGYWRKGKKIYEKENKIH
jgi:hypothetical protein